MCVNCLEQSAHAEAVVTRIRENGGEAFLHPADVSVESHVIDLFAAVDREYGNLSALVNNAGILGRVGPLATATIDDVRRVFDVNLMGTFLCSREAITRMSTRNGGEGGAIVNISSTAATLGGAHQWLAYATSKGAINTFTLGLAREVASEGIRVNAVCPGLIETESHASAGLGDRLKELAPSVPIQRPGKALEVAEAIMWLLSDQASYCVGANILVSGGR